MGMIPSPVVRAFHPKTPFNCSLRADTSHPVFSSRSGSILKKRKGAKAESALKLVGSCHGRLSKSSLSLSRIRRRKSSCERDSRSELLDMVTLLIVKAEFSGSSGGGFHKGFNAKNLPPSHLDHAILMQAMLLLESELLTIIDNPKSPLVTHGVNNTLITCY